MDNETKDYLAKKMKELRHKVEVSKKFTKKRNWNNEGHNINNALCCYACNNLLSLTPPPHLKLWRKTHDTNRR